jgi:NodT family efflux transporter outer membrane factor (OMF) lipoprotein
VKPSIDVPAAYKESAGWKIAEPRDQETRGKWWEIYQDPLLNSLEEQVSISNQNLAQAEARYRQASALVQTARASYYPTVTGDVSTSRGNRGNGIISSTNTNHSLSASANWEIDLWGRIRRTVEANQASAQASAADLEATRLSTQAQLAQTYFQLRTVDAQQDLFDRTVADYEKSLQLTQNQYAAGIVPTANVVQAQTQLKTTQAQLVDLGVTRAQLEHAIALLVGKPASSFSIAHGTLTATVPSLPIGVPSSMLERRPDIAAAERRVAAANAQIGVAKAAYFPDLTLAATGGFQGSSFANWLTLPNRFWSVGPALAMTLFDGGARRAQTDQAIAAYDASVAAYRQTVLTSFQEVEDNLSALRLLEQEAQLQDEALQASRKSVELTTNQYRSGIVSYLNVIAVQTTALGNERTVLDIQNRRLAASVQLIAALGGDWHETKQ